MMKKPLFKKTAVNKMKGFFRKPALAAVLAFVSVTGFMGISRNDRNPAKDAPGRADSVEMNQKLLPLSLNFNRRSLLFQTNEETPTLVCASNDNTAEMQQKLPVLSGYFNLMAQLPITGKPVYDAMIDPKNGLTLCVMNEETDALGSYLDQRLILYAGSGASTVFHEGFHAVQDKGNAYDREFSLTKKDLIIAILLEESTAVAYELAVQQEAKNHNLYVEHGTLFSAANNPFTKFTFQEAYNKAWRDNAALDAKTREAKALEAGGQAVVRRLMSGKDSRWSTSYLEQSLDALHANSACFCDDGRELRADYKENRSAFYAHVGHLSTGINFVPEEFLRGDADQHIDKSFRDVGMNEAKYPLPSLACAIPFMPMALLLGGLGLAGGLLIHIRRRAAARAPGLKPAFPHP